MEELAALSSLRWIRRFFMLMTAAGIIYMALFWMKAARVPLADVETAPEPAAVPVQGRILDSGPSMQELAALLEARNIFMPAPAGAVAASAATPAGQLPDNLKIVGIIVGTPSQVIIEDAQAKQTYFLNEGDTQAGVTVKHINSDQVVLAFQGQDIAVAFTQPVTATNTLNAPPTF